MNATTNPAEITETEIESYLSEQEPDKDTTRAIMDASESESYTTVLLAAARAADVQMCEDGLFSEAAEARDIIANAARELAALELRMRREGKWG